jgi:serine/threonine protein kinase
VPVTHVEGICLGCAGRAVETSLFDSGRRPPVLELIPPQVPGWEIQRALGLGGMGELWLARRTEPAETGVVKLARAGAPGSAEARMETEADILTSLDHPNILRVLDIATAGDGRLAMVVEYVSGCDLRRLLRAEKLPKERAVGIFLKVCGAVSHAHGRGVIHRDLKPSNILVDAAGTVKVADFGLARDATGSGTLHTSEGDGLGTPYYLAPELLRDASAADARADVYALGVLLYELLTGTVPLGTYAPVSSLCGMDRAWDQVIREALMQDRNRRTATVDALRAAVESLWIREQHRGLWKGRWRPLGLAGAVVLSAIAGAGITHVLKVPPPPPPGWPDAADTTRSQPWENSLGMKFLPVPGHPLLMGLHEVRRSDLEAYRAYENALRPEYRPERPRKKRLGVLTRDGWVMREVGVDDPGFEVSDDHPAYGVFPSEARFFCAWLTLREQAAGRLRPHQFYRLPRVEEWIAAAGERSENAGNFSGPEARDDQWPPDRPVHDAADPFPRSAPVGSFPANALGFHDLLGNVSEISVPDDAEGEDTPYTTPLVRLGGSWAHPPDRDVKGQFGKITRSVAQSADVGFRCVLDLGGGAAGE